jgi:hypothetical protein
MSRFVEVNSSERNQILIFLGISLFIATLTIILYIRNAYLFQAFFGVINPLVVVFIIILLGTILSTFLLSRGWFAIYKSGNFIGFLVAGGLAALLSLGIILVDLKTPFPADINRPFPDSLFFYPIFGYVVEVIFHILPLALLLTLLTSIFKRLDFEKAVWICIFLVTLLEPIFQTILGSSNSYPIWVTGYVFVNIFMFNLFQLLIFKRYDFVSMFSFRLVYYAIWHIGWGYVRLGLLF